MGFEGFPVAALDFYDDLEMDNTKSYWEAHKQVYQEAVRAPMLALTDELADEFGPATLFRPHRDVRFAKDKSPIKTHQGAYVRAAEGTGWYVAISAKGVFVGGGFYSGAAEQTASLRRAIADDRRGTELETIVARLDAAGFTIGGDAVKTAPRGYDKDHPRIALLRHKSMTFGTDHTHEDEDIHTARLVGKVREDWRRLRPFVDWLARAFS